jgi:TRAP-type transport system periplasmic protein
VLLGFVEGGWVYLFSKQDLSTAKGFQSANMWVWKGDRMAEMLLNNFGMRTTPLHVADVTTGLERGMIDSFYAPPLAAIAFQWHVRVTYMLDYPLANSNAALLMTKRAFYALPTVHQKTLRSLARKHCRDLVTLTRQDNEKALAVMHAQGMVFVRPDRAQIEAFLAGARTTYAQSVPDLYPQALLDRIQTILSRLRTTAPQPNGP